jgi:putative ABC transport system ATP-binding protein
MLELEGVTKQYASAGDVVRALSGVSLRVAPGELVAIVGPSGSGKTTLLLLAAALLRPDAGSVRFGGRDLSSLSSDEAADYRMRTVGFVVQSPRLLPMTAAENAALPLLGRGRPLREAIPAATKTLARVGLGELAHRYPDTLSSGERQRVAIAQALARDPRLLLADEPTGALDTQRGEQILDLLAGLCAEHEAAGVLVTHDPRAAGRANRVITLSDGRLQARGQPDTTAPVAAARQVLTTPRQAPTRRGP